jgi:hypothetical protein
MNIYTMFKRESLPKNSLTLCMLQRISCFLSKNKGKGSLLFFTKSTE